MLRFALLDSSHTNQLVTAYVIYLALFQPFELQGHASDPGGLGRIEQHAEIGRARCE